MRPVWGGDEPTSGPPDVGAAVPAAPDRRPPDPSWVRIRRWLAGTGEDPLRVVQRFLFFFVVCNVSTVLPQLIAAGVRGQRLAAGVALIIGLAALRLAEYMRGRPLSPLFDVLECAAFTTLVFLGGSWQVVQGALFSALQYRAVLSSRPRVITVVVGYCAVALVPHYLDAAIPPVPPEELIGLVVVPWVVYVLRVVMVRAQRRHRQQHVLLEAVVGRLPNAVLVTDGSGALTLANPAADRLFRWPADARPPSLAGLIALDPDGGPVDLGGLAVTTANTGRRANDLELDIVRADGTRRRVIVDAQPLSAQLREARGAVIGLTDVTAQRRYEEQLRHLASHDPLTRLPNRLLFQQRLAAAANAPAGYAVLLVDLNGFKAVNDRLGHHAGDELLQAVAGRLAARTPAGSTVARLGGDEFAVVLPGATIDGARSAAGRFAGCFAEPFDLSAGLLHCAATIGFAVATAGRPPHEALAEADLAMYARKPWRAGDAEPSHAG
ncbi:MAG TPA: diguanylate cyclase [Pilimelia sp.]|nr:diguanylate cyclase [Pilimelia sp.]